MACMSDYIPMFYMDVISYPCHNLSYSVIVNNMITPHKKKTKTVSWWGLQIDGLVQERCNSIASTLELCLSCPKAIKIYPTVASQPNINNQDTTPVTCVPSTNSYLGRGLYKSNGIIMFTGSLQHFIGYFDRIAMMLQCR